MTNLSTNSSRGRKRETEKRLRQNPPKEGKGGLNGESKNNTFPQGDFVSQFWLNFKMNKGRGEHIVWYIHFTMRCQKQQDRIEDQIG